MASRRPVQDKTKQNADDRRCCNAKQSLKMAELAPLFGNKVVVAQPTPQMYAIPEEKDGLKCRPRDERERANVVRRIGPRWPERWNLPSKRSSAVQPCVSGLLKCNTGDCRAPVAVWDLYKVVQRRQAV